MATAGEQSGNYSYEDFFDDVPESNPNKPNITREMAKMENARVRGEAYASTSLFAADAAKYLLARDKAGKGTYPNKMVAPEYTNPPKKTVITKMPGGAISGKKE